MNLRTNIIIVALGAAACWLLAKNIYSNGWNEGRQNLIQQQAEQARAKLAKQTARQQANDSKAAAADDEGEAKTVTITQEVIRYVKTPGRNVCVFDDTRVKLKQAAVDNANHIEGYDRE